MKNLQGVEVPLLLGAGAVRPVSSGQERPEDEPNKPKDSEVRGGQQSLAAPDQTRRRARGDWWPDFVQG